MPVTVGAGGGFGVAGQSSRIFLCIRKISHTNHVLGSGTCGHRHVVMSSLDLVSFSRSRSFNEESTRRSEQREVKKT